MSRRTRPLRADTARRAARATIAGCAAAVITLLAIAAPAPAVVKGTPVKITAVPWQVLVVTEKSSCGGSVLSSTRVLTAAHCLIDGTRLRPASSVTVLAGADDASNWAPGETPPPGSQAVKAASLRTHPYYVGMPAPAADVGVITLDKPLNLSTSRVKPIALAPVGGGPAPGTPLQATGYGAQSPKPVPPGKLYAAALATLSDYDCLGKITPNQTATVLCANGPTGSAICVGDSGGPLTAGRVLVGVVSGYSGDGADACTGPWPGKFADVTAPEIRAFIDGSATPPRAPRLGADAGLNGIDPPVVGSPLTCTPGAWTDAASVAYTFLNPASGQPLQAGATATFAPSAAHLGMPITCVVSATNAGGVSIARTATAPGIQPDSVAPRGVLRSARCRKRRCTVRLQAGDANSLGAISVQVKAVRKAGRKCRKKGKARRARCSKKRRTTTFAVTHAGGVNWIAKAKRVPRGRTTVRLRVIDAAGNRARGRALKARIRVR